MLLQLADKLQDNSIIVALTSTGWTAAGLAILHYYSMFVLVGSMAIVDLRVLGVLGRDESASTMARRIFPWIWASLAVSLLSGFVMFAGDATAYVRTHSFQFKIFVVLMAMLFGALLHWRIPSSDQAAELPGGAKVIAGISLLLWAGAILMGVEVPAISHIG